MSSTALAIIATKATKNIKPPLSRNEIITALALRKQQQMLAEVDARVKRRAVIQARIDELIAGFTAQGAKPTFKFGGEHKRLTTSNPRERYFPCYIERKHIEIKQEKTIMLDQLSPELRSLVKELNKLDAISDHVPLFKDIKRDVRDSMTGDTTAPDQRIAALLSDPATLKALDKTLASLDRKPEAPAAIAA